MENENINTNATDTQVNSTNESKSESFANEALTANTNYGTISSADIENGTAELVLMPPFEGDDGGISVMCVGGENSESDGASICVEELSVDEFKRGTISFVGEFHWYKINPQESARYYFRTTKNTKIRGVLYSEEVDLKSPKDSYAECIDCDIVRISDNNLAFAADLLCNKTYYIYVYGLSTGLYEICVSKNDIREVRVDGNVDIFDIPDENGIRTGSFSSNEKVVVIYTPTDDPTWVYISGEVNFNETITRRYGWCKNAFLRQIEYHLIPYSLSDMAICIYAYQDERLKSDAGLILQKKSYRNMQKWTMSKFQSDTKLFTKHGDNFVLCQKEDSYEAIVSPEASDTRSRLKFISVPGENSLYRIKIINTDLYLTIIKNNDEEYKLGWLPGDDSNINSQRWFLEEQGSNFHNGLDTSFILSATTVGKLSAANEEFVVRYYSREDNKHKILTSDEIKYLKANNIKIVCVYQDNGDEEDSFVEEKGTRNAQRALELAEKLGQAKDSAIYFAIDDGDISEELVQSYFEEIKTVFDDNGNKYKIGIYGSYRHCQLIKQELSIAEFSWLAARNEKKDSFNTGYMDFCSYNNPSKYNIKQSELIYYNGIKFDDNVAFNDNYGQW